MAATADARMNCISLTAQKSVGKVTEAHSEACDNTSKNCSQCDTDAGLETSSSVLTLTEMLLITE